MTSDRRQFTKTIGSVAAGLLFTTCSSRAYAQAAEQTGTLPKRRTVLLGGKRIRTIDIHAHCCVPEAFDLVKEYEWSGAARQALDNKDYGKQLGLTGVEGRLKTMDAWGID